MGVEGIDEDVILDALIRAGCSIDGEQEMSQKAQVTKADFMRLGLSGGTNSQKKRLALLEKLSLPAKISSNMLLDIINRMYTEEEFERICSELE